MIASFPYKKLLDWYKIHGRKELPWRNFSWLPEEDITYRVWLSEILLQQTQAPRVVAFFERILERFPHIQDLAKASYEEFFPYYDGLGYYSRARNLLKTAKIVSEEFRGKFPKESSELVKLPGVWPYTAEAIRAFAFEIPTLSFDTNLEKVFSRYYFGSRFIKLSKLDKKQILSDFLATKLPSREICAAFMDFANIVSLNTKQKIDFPLYRTTFPDCVFAKNGGVLEEELRQKADIFPIRDAQIFVFLKDHDGKRIFSAKDDEKYTPFSLPANPDTEHREVIKSYFLKTFSVAVSVRPVFYKGYFEDAPIALYRARIQTGDASSFYVSTKEKLVEAELHLQKK